MPITRSLCRALGLALVLPALALPGLARADQLLETYEAFIGEDDLYNSRGDRLTEPWQIIRQDRANFHRFRIRDRGDQSDSFFASAENRERAERMVMDGHIDRAAARALVQGGVTIRVEIWGRGNVGKWLDITVY